VLLWVPVPETRNRYRAPVASVPLIVTFVAVVVLVLSITCQSVDVPEVIVDLEKEKLTRLKKSK